MEINGNLVFWLVCLGMLTGGVAKLFFGSRGRSTAANVIGGALWAVMAGLIGEAYGIGGSIAFGVMGTTAFLILLNVFCFVRDPEDNRSMNKM